MKANRKKDLSPNYFSFQTSNSVEGNHKRFASNKKKRKLDDHKDNNMFMLIKRANLLSLTKFSDNNL